MVSAGGQYTEKWEMQQGGFGGFGFSCPMRFSGVVGAISANGPRVYEPARWAQAVAILPLCNRRDHRAGCRRPSDERSEERRVNPLLAVVVASVLPPALPRTAGPRIGRCSFWNPPNSSLLQQQNATECTSICVPSFLDEQVDFPSDGMEPH